MSPVLLACFSRVKQEKGRETSITVLVRKYHLQINVKSGGIFFSVNLERPVFFPCLQPQGRGLFELPLEQYGNTSCLRAKHLVLNPSVSTLTHLFPWTLTILEKISVRTSKWMIRSQRNCSGFLRFFSDCSAYLGGQILL